MNSHERTDGGPWAACQVCALLLCTASAPPLSRGHGSGYSSEHQAWFVTVGSSLVPLGLLEQAGHSRVGRRPRWLPLAAMWARHSRGSCERQAPKVLVSYLGLKLSVHKMGKRFVLVAREGWQGTVSGEEEEERGVGVYPELPPVFDLQLR